MLMKQSYAPFELTSEISRDVLYCFRDRLFSPAHSATFVRGRAGVTATVYKGVVLCLVAESSSKRNATSEAPAMTQAAIKKLVAGLVFPHAEAQAANMQD
ncbi:hypothetical protein Tco_0448166 [Tanacetum coccineum]